MKEGSKNHPRITVIRFPVSETMRPSRGLGGKKDRGEGQTRIWGNAMNIFRHQEKNRIGKKASGDNQRNDLKVLCDWNFILTNFSGQLNFFRKIRIPIESSAKQYFLILKFFFSKYKGRRL